MSNNSITYEYMGSTLARLPFKTSLKSIDSSTITDEEKSALHHALQVTVTELMLSGTFYEINSAGVEDFAKGFAAELTRIFACGREKISCPLVQTMQVDGHQWELLFDPGPKIDHLRTDEKGRVWHKVENHFEDFVDDCPF